MRISGALIRKFIKIYGWNSWKYHSFFGAYFIHLLHNKRIKYACVQIKIWIYKYNNNKYSISLWRNAFANSIKIEHIIIFENFFNVQLIVSYFSIVKESKYQTNVKQM